ncbi:HDOD domain-containing protein [Myxococcota bacterium]|nr:HDOD domain-containing protein [Myxococcota bacterium]MBU1380757.1 HDOD domain-containing protein [Myxococcota bacterium]MBU1497094.1 HDOD domain-containing protein [Myxococcota bacterium]
MSPRIIFVDDEPHVLAGLRRMLRSMRDSWEMSFASSGEQALKLMDLMKFDVIISDMRMPEMSGAELLTRVMEKHPETVRIVLSGYSDIELVLKSILPAHQYISKPCEPEKLRDVVERALNMSKIISNEKVKEIVTKIETLPVLPGVYQELMNEINKPECSLPEIGRIISRDVGMSAKILKLVNSSFFGFARHIGSTEQAVNLIGLNVMKAIILYENIFNVCEASTLKNLKLERVWEHSINVGRIAKRLIEITPQTTGDKQLSEEAFIAGMLHDVGKIILGANFHDTYIHIHNRIKTEKLSMEELELEEIGTTHAEVGAYLLGLWGTSEPIVEAIAFHHSPMATTSEIRPLAVVYAADYFEREETQINVALLPFNADYFSKLGLSTMIDKYRKETATILGQ